MKRLEKIIEDERNYSMKREWIHRMEEIWID